MGLRSLTPADITSLLELYGCSDEVIYNAVRSIDMVNMFLEFKSFSRVAVVYKNEYQFFENHVLQDEILFVDFYNGLLDKLEVGQKSNVRNDEETSEVEESR